VSEPSSRDSREYPARPIVGVGAVILTSNPLGVVLIRRRYEPLAGRWSLPGGTVEVGEMLEAALVREIAEETGLEVTVGPVIEVFDRILRDGEGRVRFHFVLIDYLCRPSGGRLQHGSDVDDAVVADPGGLDAFNLTEKALAVIRQGLEMSRAARPTLRYNSRLL